MNPIRHLRAMAGVTQRELANRAKTSQPTIALYESGAKSPTLHTVRRLAEAVGLESVMTYTPRMTREDHRSLAYHHAIAQHMLQCDPTVTIARARRTAQRLRAKHLHARALLDQWVIWLTLPVPDLIARMLDPGVISREMRHISPFAGILAPSERVRVLRAFRKEYDG